MAKRLTPEEKAQRVLDQAAAKAAERLAKNQARQAAWEAQRLAAKTAFEAGLSQKEKDAIAAILVPKEMVQDPYREHGVLMAVFESEFIGSLYGQLNSRGYLSPAQLAPVVRAFERKVEFEAKSKDWGDVANGDEVKALCKVCKIEQRPNVGFGVSFKIRLKAHNGRDLHVNTNAQRFLTIARQAMEEDTPVNVQGKAGWASPNGSVIILDKKGLYFQLL